MYKAVFYLLVNYTLTRTGPRAESAAAHRHNKTPQTHKHRQNKTTGEDGEKKTRDRKAKTSRSSSFVEANEFQGFLLPIWELDEDVTAEWTQKINFTKCTKLLKQVDLCASTLCVWIISKIWEITLRMMRNLQKKCCNFDKFVP